MRSDLPKVTHPIAGVPMIQHVLNACVALSPEKIIIVVAPGMKDVEQAVAPYPCVIQPKALGTGDAVKPAAKELKDFKGDVIVLFGDAPLMTPEALKNLQKRRAETNATVVVAGFTPENPGAYGRLLLDIKGNLSGIVEAVDATTEQRDIRLCNGGIMLFAGDKLSGLLDQLKDNNAKQEFYLTDCIALAKKAGEVCVVAEMAADEVLGINTRVELAQAEKLMQKRLREKAMLGGATMIDPDSVFLCADTIIGRDVVIGPNVVFGPGVKIGDRVEIEAFCHLEQTTVEAAATLGPFARIRPGSVIGAEAHIGNFVEIKKAAIGAGAKIGHLSYIGDATVGAKANIGAGTITCNYDGFKKNQTQIGAGAFIGSNSSLVAPVKIGDGAYVGAGSVITMEVPAETLAVARGRQSNIEDWVRRMRGDKVAK